MYIEQGLEAYLTGNLGYFAKIHHGAACETGVNQPAQCNTALCILSRTTPWDCAYTSGSAADKAQVEQRLLANLYCTWCYSLIESRI